MEEPPILHAVLHKTGANAPRLFVASLHPRGGTYGDGGGGTPCAACAAACPSGPSLFATSLLQHWTAAPWDLLVNTAVVHSTQNTFLVNPCATQGCPLAGVLVLPRGNTLGDALRTTYEDLGTPLAVCGVRVAIATPQCLHTIAAAQTHAAALDSPGVHTGAAASVFCTTGRPRIAATYAPGVSNAMDRADPARVFHSVRHMHVPIRDYPSCTVLSNAHRAAKWMDQKMATLPLNVYANSDELDDMRARRDRQYARCRTAMLRVTTSVSVWPTAEGSAVLMPYIFDGVREEATRAVPAVMGWRLLDMAPTTLHRAMRGCKEVYAGGKARGIAAVWTCPIPHYDALSQLLTAFQSHTSTGASVCGPVLWLVPSGWSTFIRRAAAALDRSDAVHNLLSVLTLDAPFTPAQDHVYLLDVGQAKGRRSMAALTHVVAAGVKFSTLALHTSMRTLAHDVLGTLRHNVLALQLVHDTGQPMTTQTDLALFLAEAASVGALPGTMAQVQMTPAVWAPAVGPPADPKAQTTQLLPATMRSWILRAHVPGAPTHAARDAIRQTEHAVVLRQHRAQLDWPPLLSSSALSRSAAWEGGLLCAQYHDPRSFMARAVLAPRMGAFGTTETAWAACDGFFVRAGVAAAHLQAHAIVTQAGRRMHHALHALRALLHGAASSVHTETAHSPQQPMPHWLLLDLPVRLWQSRSSAVFRGGRALTEASVQVHLAPGPVRGAVVQNAIAFPSPDDAAVMSPPTAPVSLEYLPTPHGVAFGMLWSLLRVYHAARTCMVRAHHAASRSSAAMHQVHAAAQRGEDVLQQQTTDVPATCVMCFDRPVDVTWPCGHGTCSVCSMQSTLHKSRQGLDMDEHLDHNRGRDTVLPHLDTAHAAMRRVQTESHTPDQLQTLCVQACYEALQQSTQGAWRDTSSLHCTALLDRAAPPLTDAALSICIGGDIASDFTRDVTRREFCCPICRGTGGMPPAVARSILDQSIPPESQAAYARAKEWCAAAPEHTVLVVDPAVEHTGSRLYAQLGDRLTLYRGTEPLMKQYARCLQRHPNVRSTSPATILIVSTVALAPEILACVSSPVSIVHCVSGPPE